MILVIEPNDKGYWLGWPEFKAYLLLLYHSWEMTCTSHPLPPTTHSFGIDQACFVMETILLLHDLISEMLNDLRACPRESVLSVRK